MSLTKGTVGGLSEITYVKYLKALFQQKSRKRKAKEKDILFLMWNYTMPTPVGFREQGGRKKNYKITLFSDRQFEYPHPQDAIVPISNWFF